MGIRSGIHNIKSYLTEGIWSENFEELSRMRLRIVKDLQVLMLTIKTFSAQKIGFQAVALAFFCTMAAVPFIAIAFVITGGLGLEGLLRNALITHISNPQAIDTFVQLCRECHQHRQIESCRTGERNLLCLARNLDDDVRGISVQQCLEG